MSYAICFAVLKCLKLRNGEWSTIDVANNLYWFDLILSPWWREMTFEQFSYFLTGIVIQPISLLVGLLCKLLRTPYVLPVLQALSIAACIPLLYAVALRRLGSPWQALVVAAAFALNPYINTETMFGFRWDALALPLMIALVLARQLNNRRLFWAVLVLGCACKLNILLINGIYCAIAYRRSGLSYLRRGVWVCAIWFVAALSASTLIKLYAPNLIFDQTPPAMLSANLLGPLADDPSMLWPVLGDFFGSGAWLWLPEYLLPLLFLPLAAPAALLPVLVEFGYVLLFSLGLEQMPGLNILHELMLDKGYLFIYPAVFLVGYLHLASIEAIASLRQRYGVRRIHALAGLWLVMALATHWFLTPSIFGPVPLTDKFNLDYYRMSDHQRTALAAFESFPKDLQPLLSSTFCERPDGYPVRDYIAEWLPAEYHEFNVVLVDLYAFEFAISRQRLIDKLLFLTVSHPRMGVTYFEDGIIEMRMGAPRTRNREVAQFIAENLPLLLHNLPNPYTDGGQIDLGPGAERRFYSPTQLTSADRQRLGL
ncbi:MAG: DUF2079 domain-containing protein [Candidatus Alcyoniella australis]|nr:DUF2079 domain-containing protein [Candidatus Alcyoniella australis]